MLALDRRIPDNVADLRAGTLEQEGVLEGRGLFGRTLGLLGAGSIAPRGDPPRRAPSACRSCCGAAASTARRDTLTGAECARARASRDAHACVGSRRRPAEVAARCDVLSVHLALGAGDAAASSDARCSDGCGPARSSSTPRAARWSITRRSPRRSRDARPARRPRRLRRTSRRPRPATFDDAARRAARRLRHAPHRRVDRSGAGSDRRRDRAHRPRLQGDRPGAERRQPRAAHAGDAPAGRAPPRSARRARARLRPAAQRAASTCRRPRTSSSRAPRPRSPASTSTARRDGDAARRASRPATPTSSICRSCRCSPSIRADPPVRSEPSMPTATNASTTSAPVRRCCPCRSSKRRSAISSSLPGVGMSVLEISHRSKAFDDDHPHGRGRHPRRSPASPTTTTSCSCRAAPACSSRWCR